jgi:hypothetical protein
MARNSPRISVNKLGEYLIANPVRRRAIIKGQKNPPDVVVARYRKAYPILDQYFQTRDPNVIYDGAEALRAEAATSDWIANDNANTATALESFVDTVDQLPIDDCDIQLVLSDEFPPIIMGGVAVSIRPDFYVKQSRRGQNYVGALKFHWTKDDGSELGESGGTYVATALHQFLLEHPEVGFTADYRLSYSVDVFRQSAWEAPPSFRRLRTHLEAACEEIALRWETV